MFKMRIAPILLACAAAFTFSAAQSGFGDESSSDPPPFESYDIGPYSGGGGRDNSGDASAEDADDGAEAKKNSAKKQPAEEKERSVRNKRSALSFSSTFSGPQKSCPVCSSVRLKNNLSVDYSGGRIHVCSATCIDRVRRSPAAFADILVKRGEELSTP